MLHITKPDTKKPRRRYLLINPPIEEPYRYRAPDNAPGDADGEEGGASYDETSGFAGRRYTYPLPIGLRRIANQLLREGNEIYFLDGFSAQGRAYPSSRERSTPSEVPDFALTDTSRVRYFHLGLTYAEIERILRDVEVDEVFVGPYPRIDDESLNYDFLGLPPGFILVKGTSGCPHQCAYCAVHLLEGRRFRHRDPLEVFDEIRRGHERYGLVEVGIWDSNVLMQYDEYLGVILERMVASGLNLRLAAPEGFDYRLMTPQVARDLKAAGFRSISLALENADAAFASDRLNRHNDAQRLQDAIASLNQAGFEGRHLRLFVIVGLPGQTIENVIANIAFVWSLGCNVTLFPFTPIPGTAMYETYRDQLRDLPLRALHPTLYPYVPDGRTRDLLIGLTGLGRLNRTGKAQAEHFREVISSDELIRMLS